MPRFPRVYFEGALYYITTKADYELELFRDDGDRARYISFLLEYKKLYNFKLYAFVLTSKESYLIIEPSRKFTISQIMHDVNVNYTKYYNKKYEKKGHLFEERFKATLVEKQGHLLELTRLVHRVALKENPALPLADWRWSSYPSYISKEQDKGVSLIVDCGEVFGLIPGSAENKAASYRDFTEKAGQDELEVFENKMYRTSVVGSEDFVEKVRQISKTAVEEAEGERQAEAASLVAAKKRIKAIVYVSAVFVLVFVLINSFLLKGNASLKNQVKEVAQAKDEMYAKDLISTKKEISRELEEKYRADMISYKVTAIRLKELEEKNRSKEEKKL